ncbi:MAG: phage tail sheath C-terminal domain-containing protein [Myxococcota bacterium]
MPVNPTYPGVYVQEVPSGVRTIVGVGTSTTLFVGRTKQGPLDTPLRLTNYSDFVRNFGEDNTVSDMSRYVRLFFLNGGTDCYVIRVAKDAATSTVTLLNEAGTPSLEVRAKQAGVLGNSIRIGVDYNTAFPEATFNLEVFRWEVGPTGQRSKVETEKWSNLSMDPASSTFAPTFLTQKSKLIEVSAPFSGPSGRSRSGRPVLNNPAGDTEFLNVWPALIPANSEFRISVDGSPVVTATLNVNWATVADAAQSIVEAIDDALAAAGAQIVAPATTVSFVQGPAPTAGETRILSIASASGGDVRIQTALDPNRDVARSLLLGTENGGIEVGAYADARPAPTGVSFLASDLSSWNTFAGTDQGDIVHVILDELDANGNLVPTPPITFNLNTTANLTDPMWNELGGGSDGVREKLRLIRDAVNNYQSNNASKFFWRAELWGSRLAFIRTRGDDNALAPFATGTTDISTQFLGNVRYYSVGLGGSQGQQTPGLSGSDGQSPEPVHYRDAYEIAASDIDLFNILVLPPDNGAGATPLTSLWNDASVFCEQQRAFLIMDDPGWSSSQEASTGVDALRIGLAKGHSAVYFPRLQMLEDGLVVNVGAAGAMAGLYARTDANRGVWKAPAGTEADIRGVVGVDVQLSDGENGQFNPVAVNGIRVFPNGVVSWGARTMDGADSFASEYKYIPIRRLAEFIKESLYRGLSWVVFEPNDEGLWSQIRLNAGAFMQNLYRQGAFQGQSPREAYFVKCDAETTTQNDRNLGIVNIWIGFAPLKPAEFVVLNLQQIAGQIEA